jgi:short-subunit dehydrogenase
MGYLYLHIVVGFLFRKKGVIINIASFAATTFFPLTGTYAATKVLDHFEN